MLHGLEHLIITLCPEGGWECMWGRDDEIKNSEVEKSAWLFVPAVTLRGRAEHSQQSQLHTASLTDTQGWGEVWLCHMHSVAVPAHVMPGTG